jgi:ankyrin repeat protein
MLFASKEIRIYTYLMLVYCSGMYLTKAMEQEALDREQKAAEETGSLETLPRDVKTYIISFLESAENIHQAIKNIQSLSRTSREFNALINNPRALGNFIQDISKQYTISPVDVAIAFSTPSALKWLKDYLQQHPKEKEPLNKHLLEAIEKGNKNLIEFALYAGADVNKADEDGNTPLHEATSSGKKDIVKLLLNAGATINQGNNEGLTPLHWAVHNGNKAMVEFLLQHKANINQTDRSGHTPLYWSTLKGRKGKDIVELLRKHGAV